MNRENNRAPLFPDDVAATAAEWVMRLDRGLSPAEQDEYLHWLAADARHGEAMARYRRTWEAFDRLAGLQASVEAVPDPDLLRPRDRSARRWLGWVTVPLAAAAALAVIHWTREPAATPRPPVSSPAVAESLQLTPIKERTLVDGSTIRLNRGAQVAVEFSPAERRVRLERGEAAFEVAKDAARPFVVVAGGVAVRAVGTAFNVRLDSIAVEVLVTAGLVSVAPGEGQRTTEHGALTMDHGPQTTDHRAPTTDRGERTKATEPLTSDLRSLTSDFQPPTSGTLVSAGQRVVVSLATAGESPRVSTPSPEELVRRLAWQPRLLTFSDEPLAVILEAFNRHNPVTLRIDDPALQELRLSARFRSDNVPGFLRLLESEFRVRAQPEGDGEIVLRTAR